LTYQIRKLLEIRLELRQLIFIYHFDEIDLEQSTASGHNFAQIAREVHKAGYVAVGSCLFQISYPNL
jgi:hypothetical protein